MNNYKICLLMFLMSCERSQPTVVSYQDTVSYQNITSSENKLRKSYALSDILFIEEYNTYEGSGFTRMATVYLTDSLNFKVVVANFDEHTNYEVIYDSITNSVTGMGLEYKGKADSVLGIDTINLNRYSEIHRMDSALNNSAVLGGGDCVNAEFKSRYRMSRARWSVPENLTLTGEDYVCDGSYLRAYYLSDLDNFRILLKVNQSNKYFPYIFENLSDSLLLLKQVKLYDIYDTLYVNTLSIDSLLEDEKFRKK